MGFQALPSLTWPLDKGAGFSPPLHQAEAQPVSGGGSAGTELGRAEQGSPSPLSWGGPGRGEAQSIPLQGGLGWAAQG